MSTYPNSTTTMKARLLLSLLVVFKYIRCCAAQLDFLSISISSSVYEDCQQCLIERAGAIHLEKVDEFHKSVTEMYWVVGPSHYLRANLISCFGRRYCRDPTIEDYRSIFVTEGIGSTPSPFVSSENPTYTYISNERQHWANSADLRTVQQTDLSLDINDAGQIFVEGSKTESKQLCVYRSYFDFSFLCETFMNK